MKKTQNTVKNEKKEMLTLCIGVAVIALLIVAIILVGVALSKIDKTPEKLPFTPPPFDDRAVVGEPEVPEELGFATIDDPSKVPFTLGFCSNLYVNSDNETDIYFTSMASNEGIWFKIRILDASGDVVCETGLIRPGEYLKTIKFNRKMKNAEELTIKVMSYEAETYHSLGSINLVPYVIVD